MKHLLLLFIVAGLAGSAQALTLKEKKQLEAWKKELSDPDHSYIGKVKEKCGYDIPYTFDEALVTPFMAENTSASSYCDAAFSTISDMCDDATSKAAIKAKIKKIACKLGKEKTAEFKIQNGEFQFIFGVNASNLNDKIKTYLENNL